MKKNLAACGALREGSWQYHAHFNFRNAEGRQENIVGPKRTERALAKEDLAAIRAYGALFGKIAKEVFVPCALKLGGSKNASLSSMRSAQQWSAKGKR